MMVTMSCDIMLYWWIVITNVMFVTTMIRPESQGGTSSARDHDVDGVISVSFIIRLISGVSTAQLPQLIQIKSIKKVLKCFVTRIVSHVMNVSTIVIIWQKM